MSVLVQDAIHGWTHARLIETRVGMCGGSLQQISSPGPCTSLFWSRMKSCIASILFALHRSSLLPPSERRTCVSHLQRKSTANFLASKSFISRLQSNTSMSATIGEAGAKPADTSSTTVAKSLGMRKNGTQLLVSLACDSQADSCTWFGS